MLHHCLLEGMVLIRVNGASTIVSKCEVLVELACVGVGAEIFYAAVTSTKQSRAPKNGFSLIKAVCLVDNSAMRGVLRSVDSEAVLLLLSTIPIP